MISFIVPVYHAEKTIERCVQSILCQQCPSKEIILVNDGSKDGTLEILRALEARHSEITVIDKPNGGAASARNAGLAVCRGEYVAFVDSDDYYLTDHYASDMVKLLEDNETADLVISGFTLLTPDQQKTYCVPRHTEDIVDVADRYWQYCRKDVTNSSCNKLFRKDLIREPFPEQMTMGEDAVFVLRYLQNCRQVIFDDNCGYGYVYELKSSTADYRKNVPYDINQTRIHHDAIHSLWERFLPEDLIALRYIQMKTDEVYYMMRSLLFKKGLAAYLKWDIADVITDTRVQRYYSLASNQLGREPHKELTKAIVDADATRVKLCCLLYVSVGIIRARLSKK